MGDIHRLARDVSLQVNRSAFVPEVAIAIARDGWVVGRFICDFLQMKDLMSINIDHSRTIGQRSGNPTVRYPLSKNGFENRRVLVVDEITSTGKTLERAVEYVRANDVEVVKTAVLQARENSEFNPDFRASQIDDVTWMIYPWNAVETFSDLIVNAMADSSASVFRSEELDRLISQRHGVDVSSAPSIAGMEELLVYMNNSNVITPVETDEWELDDISPGFGDGSGRTT